MTRGNEVKIVKVWVAAAFALALLLLPNNNPALAEDPFTVDEARQIAEASINLVEQHYTLREFAPGYVTELRRRLAAGDFDHTQRDAFASSLGSALLEISNDRHMAFYHDPEEYEVLLTADPVTEERSPEEQAFYLKRARGSNFGFEDLRFLPGRIGYLNLTGFWWDAEGAREKAVSAMGFLAGADAVIIDLRGNHGGSDKSVRFLQSWFFDQPTHVLTFHDTLRDEVEKSITAEPPAHGHLGKVPTYILTGSRSASAAEDFSYTMKVHEKAVLIGQTTAGAAHTVDYFPVEDGFVLGIATGRPESPVTGSNWEKKGVTPHIEAPEESALRRAHLHALNTLKETSSEETHHLYDWALVTLKAEENPPSLSRRKLRAMAGKYGPRLITYANGKLYYSRDNRPQTELVPLTDTLFRHTATNEFRLRFVEENGHVIALEGLYRTGERDRNERD